MKKHIGEKSNKCIQCDYASSLAGNLKTHWRKVKLSGREFEDAYEKTQQKPFLIDMFYMCNKSNKKTLYEEEKRVGWQESKIML